MTEIRPFRGLRYDPKRVNPDDVVAPPYDVVGADDEEALLRRSPYNAAHIECAPGDEAHRFEIAAQALRDWVAQGILIRDAEPAYYLYEQRAAIQGVTRERRAVFARLRLHQPEDGIVRPHEATMAGPRAERLALQRATGANISPIFALFRDDGRARRVFDTVAATPPAFEATDRLGDRHRLWVITDPGQQSAITEAVGASVVTIADGHHRYTTALSYLDERSAPGSLPGDASAHYILTGLVPEDDPGLVILPNHRLVRGDVPADFLAQLGERFEVTPLDGWSQDDVHDLWRRVAEGARGPATFGLLDLAEHKRYLLRGRSLAAIDEAMPRQLSPASRGLDARILTETILRPLLGIDDAALAGGQRVAFSADVDAIWRDAERDGHRLAFLLNPTRVDQVSAVADIGELMPQKTTYFYPKLATGMTFNLLDD